MSKIITPTEFGTTKEVGFDSETRKALADFISASQDEKVAKKKRAEAEAILRAKLGVAEVATVGGVPSFKIEHRNRTDINRDELRDTYPEVFEAVTYSNPYTFISALS